MAKKVIKPIGSFFNWSSEEQAKFIERETKNLIKRLPKLKANLQMYGEVSDELYNMSADELELIGRTYSRAVRSGEISTPSSKKAYQDFINNLKKYSRRSIEEIAMETAKARMESWLNNVRANGTTEEIAYAEDLVNSMTDEEKRNFTLSKYFLDTENWGSQDTFNKMTDIGQYSIQVLKLELFLEEHGHPTKNIYMTYVNNSVKDTTELRKYVRHRKKKG